MIQKVDCYRMWSELSVSNHVAAWLWKHQKIRFSNCSSW